MTGDGETRPDAGPEGAGAASESSLAVFLDLVPDAALVVDTSGTIVSANEHAASLFGYELADLEGRPVEMLVPERFRHRHRGQRSEFSAAPRTRAMGAGLELFGRRRDGSEFPVDISLAAVGTAASGLVVAAIRDATERKEAAAAHAQLAAIVRSSADGILSISGQGVITSWNPGAERLFDLPSSAAIGSHISTLIPPASSATFEELLDGARGGWESNRADTVWLTRDHGPIEVALSVSVLNDSGEGPSGYSVLVRDVTERKEAERRLWRQERLAAATAEFRLSLLSGRSVEESLMVTGRWTCELLGAPAAAVFVVSPLGTSVVAWSTERGGIEVRYGQIPSLAALEPPPALVAATMASKSVEVGSIEPSEVPGLEDVFGDSLLTAVPIPSEREPAGALVAASPAGSFDDEHLRALETVASQIPLALELSAVRADRDRLLLSSDRERIARDLHDLVIQRLFGAGLRLQGVIGMIDNPRAAERVSSAVDDLDATIREIRTAIFALEAPSETATTVRDEVVQAVEAARERLGCEPSVSFQGSTGPELPSDVRTEMLAVLREALSNVSRHAHATSVDVMLSVADELRLVVTDDGVGIGTPARRSGLANAEQRAERFGGYLEVTSPPSGGTRLTWVVPLTTMDDPALSAG